MCVFQALSNIPSRFGLLLKETHDGIAAADLIGEEFEDFVDDNAINFSTEVYFGNGHDDGHSWWFYCARSSFLLSFISGSLHAFLSLFTYLLCGLSFFVI